MSAKNILDSEQRLREANQAELDAALAAALEPNQRVERAEFRKAQYDSKIARKYRIIENDQIDVFGNILRTKGKAK